MSFIRQTLVLCASVLLVANAATAEVTLEKRSFLAGRLSVDVPREFGPMNPEILELKYPSSRRPTIVLSNPDGSVNVAINHTNDRMPQSEIRGLHSYMEGLFRNLHPSAKWNRSEVISLNGRDVFVLDLVTPAIDTQIRNILVGATLDSRFLIVTFNCTIEEEGAWGEVGERIAASVRIVE